MRKLKTLLAVICTACVAFAVVACGDSTEKPTKKTAVAAPVVNSKVYNGETQTATVTANEAYTVIENNGGVNVGEYTVVLKLTDETVYEWETPDESDETRLTLKFAITKAGNSISGLTLDGWRAGETANIPVATAEFGEVQYAYSTEQNGTYTETVPTTAGTYYVKAFVEATENYDGAESVISFVIIKAKEENAVTVSAANVKYGENAAPVITADATHVPDGAQIEYAYALTSDGEYVSWDTIEKRAGKYFVKAAVAEDDDYKGAFAIAEFEMLKGDNAINDFVINDVTCKQDPVLSATATAGTAVTYKYATAADGEYNDMPADGFVAGTYYVKAYTAGDKNYSSAESNPAMLTVRHSYAWATDENGNDYRVCACGDKEQFVITPADGILEKTESGYALKLYSAEEEGKVNKVIVSFKVTIGATEVNKAVMNWKQSTAGIVEITGDGEYTIKMAALGETVLTATYTNADGKKAHITISVTAERTTREVTVAHETVLADLATAEIDLAFASAYYTGNASMTYGDKVLGNGALSNGKLAVNLSEIAETGKLTFVVNTDKDGVYYTFDLNVLFATKIIRTADDMAAVRITTDQLNAYTPIEGYYVLGNNIDFANAQLSTAYGTVLNNLTDKYWNQNQGFRGTFDGLNHKITNVKVGQGGIFGFVGQGAVIKNVDFENISYVGAYGGSLFGFSVVNATVQNVNIQVSTYKNVMGNPESQGFFSGRFTAGSKFNNVKIDALAFDVYSLFGREFKSGTFTDVEIKVKSYTMFADIGDGVNTADKTVAPAGVTVISTNTVEIEHETILAEKTTGEIDLSFASEYFGDSISLTYNGKVLGEGAVSDGKLAVDLSGIADFGELVFVAATYKDNVIYTFDVNVILATKIIRTAEDLEVVKVTQSNIDSNTSIYGYYVLANDINIKWSKPMTSSLTYNSTVANWEPKFGFRGTFDGLGHTISGFAVNTNGMFGHVGRGAVIKNVKFDKFKYNGQYNGALFGGTVRGAEISNVTLSNVEYANISDANNAHCQGFFGSRFMQDNKLTNIKIDASGYDVYTIFGYNISNNTYSGVEVKVKSFTMLGYNGDARNETTMVHELSGVTVITADTSAEA